MSNVSTNFFSHDSDLLSIFGRVNLNAQPKQDDSEQLFDNHAAAAMFSALIDTNAEVADLLSMDEVDRDIAKNFSKDLTNQLKNIAIIEKKTGLTLDTAVQLETTGHLKALDAVINETKVSDKKDKKFKSKDTSASVFEQFMKPAQKKEVNAGEATIIERVPSVDGIELSVEDIIAVKLARLRKPFFKMLENVIKQGGEFVPSEIRAAGGDYVEMLGLREYGHEAQLVESIMPGFISMIMLMEDGAPVEMVHSTLEQIDSARDAWLASQIRNLQEKAEAGHVIDAVPGETAQARQVNQTAKPKSAKK